MAPTLSAVFAARDKLYAACLGLPGLAADAEALDDLAGRLAAAVPSLPYGVLRASVRDHALVELTADNLYDLCWRLAGNLDRLRAGSPVRPWRGQPADEWAPVQVVDVALRTLPARAGGRRAYAACRLRVLAGSACPAVLSKLWAPKFVSALVAPTLGFTRPWGKLPYADVTELTSLRFQAQLTAEHSVDGPGFDKIRCPDSMMRWNRGVLRWRWREDETFACPLGLEPDQTPCYRCPRGYASCPAACHPFDYVRGPCDGCQRETWHDPGRGPAACVECGRVPPPVGG